MKKFLLSCLFLFSSTSFASNTEEKREILWDKIAKDPYEILPTQHSSGRSLCPLNYGLGIAKSLLSPSWLVPRFTHESDEMPPEDSGHPKAIHTYGTVAKVLWKPIAVRHPFSGLFKTGGIGIMRASLAKPYEEGGSYAPGMALKFFVDAKPSVNFHVMHSLEGQGSNLNYFAEVFSNVIAEPDQWILSLIQKTSFNYAIYHLMDQGPLLATQLPLDEAASLETPWKAPMQIKFIPTAYAKNLIPENSSESDIRKQLGTILFDLEKPIYEIWADDLKIGELFLQSQFVASEYGDKVLFFKHQRRVLQESTDL